MIAICPSKSAANLAFRRAVDSLGGQVAMARLTGRTQGAISKRLAAGEPLWPENVLKVAAATGIAADDLRFELPADNFEPASALGSPTPPPGAERYPPPAAPGAHSGSARPEEVRSTVSQDADPVRADPLSGLVS